MCTYPVRLLLRFEAAAILYSQIRITRHAWADPGGRGEGDGGGSTGMAEASDELYASKRANVMLMAVYTVCYVTFKRSGLRTAWQCVGITCCQAVTAWKAVDV